MKLTDDEVLEFLDECLNDVGEVEPDDVILLAPPEGCTPEQWQMALNEYGLELANVDRS